MWKKIAIILMLPLLLMSTQIVNAGIQNFAWINPIVGDDPYYATTVVAYKTGTWWNISIGVYNNYLTPPPPPRTNLPINVTAVKVYFSWGKWYNQSFTPPLHIEPFGVNVLTIGNLTPPLTEAPETWMYSYTAYVEYIPQGSNTPITDWSHSDSNFAVMSDDHFTAFQIFNKLQSIMRTPISLESINSTEARVLMVKASMEFTLGKSSYVSGSFTDAKTHLVTADNYFSAALNAWSSTGTALENSTIDYYSALTNATKRNADAGLIQANAALNNSYGWIFFGLGWMLIGIGIIVYGTRKPKVAQS
jgi:hypothetical protein